MKRLIFLLTGVAALLPAQPTGVVPFVDCVTFDAKNNELQVFFGYLSANSGNITVPIGPLNFVGPPAVNQHIEPTVFQQGIHHNAWHTDFCLTDPSPCQTSVPFPYLPPPDEHEHYLDSSGERSHR